MPNLAILFVCLIGLGFLYQGLKTYIEIYRIKKNSITTYGEIIRYETEYRMAKDSDETDTVFYFPIARFKDLDGNFQEIKVDIGTSQNKLHKTPFKTKLYYIKENMKFKVICEETQTIKFTFSLIIIGSLMILIPLILSYYANK
jgi:hypothetical protein